MTLCYQGRIVARFELDAEGAPCAFRYDRRWLSTDGAFPASRWMPLTDKLIVGPRLGHWRRLLSQDGCAPFVGSVAIGATTRLFGGFTLMRDGGRSGCADGEGDSAQQAGRIIVARGEVGRLERVAYCRALARRCGLMITPWRFATTAEGEAIILSAADASAPLEVVALPTTPLRTGSTFRRLEGLLDAQARLSLFDRIVFAELLSAEAPTASLRLDGAARLARIGADWTGLPRRAARQSVATEVEAWSRFARAAGLNPTFAPRRALRMAALMLRESGAAADDVARSAPTLSGAALRACRGVLNERLRSVEMRAA